MPPLNLCLDSTCVISLITMKLWLNGKVIVQFTRGVRPKCWKYPSDLHHFMHAQPMGLHIVINAKEIIIASSQAVRLSLTRVDIKTHSSPFNECILLGIVNLGPATPSL